MEQEVIQEVVKEVAKKSWFSGLPKWLKTILIVISLVTVVYWVGRLVYYILELVRTLGELAFKGLSIAFTKTGEAIFEKGRFYTGISIIVIAVVVCILICEFIFDLGVFELITDWALDVWERFRETMTNLIVGG